jgi:hypothetical protein
MAAEYNRKYGVEVTQSMFSNFRYRQGLQRRKSRDHDLIPWEVHLNHRWGYPLAMLRVEARRRQGFPLRPSDVERLDAFKRRLYEDGLVVHYEPESDEGWWLVPRRDGVDRDLIREPATATTRRRNPDSC